MESKRVLRWLAAALIAGSTLGASWLLVAGAAPAAPTKGDAAAGKKIFASKCVVCHKADGSGGVKLTGNPTPNWRDAKRMADPKFTDAYFRECMTVGKIKSGMQPVAKLGVKTADQDNLIAFIRSLAKK